MTYFDQLSDPELVLHWPLNDTLSPYQPADISGRRNHASGTRASWTSADGPTQWLRRSMQRGASNNQQFVSTSGDLVFDPGTQSFTIAFWVYVHTIGLNINFLQMSHTINTVGFRCGLRATAGLPLAFSVSGSNNYSFAPDIGWQHIAFSWDHIELQLLGYKNGQLQENSGSAAFLARPSTNIFWFGGTDAHTPDGNRFAQLLLYRKVLGASALLSIAKGPSGRGFPMSRLVN